MHVVDKLFVLKDDQKIVTRVIAEGVKRSQIHLLCDELKRCCEHKVTCTKFENGICYLVPHGHIKVPDTKKIRDKFLKTSDGFFGAIYIKRDILAHKKKIIINRLKTAKDLSRFAEEKQKITEMINYLDLEGWDGTCDNDHCNNVVTIANVINNLSLECPACLQK